MILKLILLLLLSLRTPACRSSSARCQRQISPSNIGGDWNPSTRTRYYHHQKSGDQLHQNHIHHLLSCRVSHSIIHRPPIHPKPSRLELAATYSSSLGPLYLTSITDICRQSGSKSCLRLSLLWWFLMRRSLIIKRSNRLSFFNCGWGGALSLTLCTTPLHQISSTDAIPLARSPTLSLAQKASKIPFTKN